MATPSLIELLENRIAPATFVNAFVVTYTDVDGDLVKVKSSLPVFQKHLREFTFTPGGQGEELSELTLKSSASGADLTVKVIKTGASGNGSANVGFINAWDVDLRSVKIAGALDRIVAGDDDAKFRAVGTLHLASLGLEAQGEDSKLAYGAGVVRIDGDLKGAIQTYGARNTYPDDPQYLKGGDLDRLVVGGSVTGSVLLQGAVGKIKVGADVSGSISGALIGRFVVGGSIIEGIVTAAKGIGSVVIEGDIVGGANEQTGKVSYGGNNNQSFWLGGSLIGGQGSESGTFSAKQVESVTIVGSIVGGPNGDSGSIIPYDAYGPGFHYHANGRYGTIHIQGNVLGGSGPQSGGISADVRSSIVVDQSVLGGSGDRSGSITVGTVGEVLKGVKVRIGGDLVGGTGDASGVVDALASRSIVNVAIGGDVREVGSTSRWLDYPLNAGSIVGSRLGTVQIGGSVIAAERPGADNHITSYAVLATTSIANLHIAGNINGTSANLVGISAGARPMTGYTSPAGIGALSVGGSVAYADLSAGYSSMDFVWDGAEYVYNPDALIGTVRIDGNLMATSITAGIHPGADSWFGTDDDYAEAGELTDVSSRIASIIVGGHVAGTSALGDAFGIAAQQIVSMTIGGVPVPLTSELDTIQLAPNTGDVLLREHA